MDRVLIVPAAGRGSRLGAGMPKAMVPVAGRPMLEHLVAMHRTTVDQMIVVAAPEAVAVLERFAARADVAIDLAIQQEPTGMLDAILVARPAVRARRPRRVAITWCDQIAVSGATVARLARRVRAADAPALVFPTFVLDQPYIHFERNAVGAITCVRQRREGDSMPPRGEADMGLFDLSFDAYCDDLEEFASGVAHGGRTGERNFLPFIPWLALRRPVETIAGESAIETVGVNTPEELATVQEYLSRGGRAVR